MQPPMPKPKPGSPKTKTVMDPKVQTTSPGKKKPMKKGKTSPDFGR